MLDTNGVKSLEELMDQTVPDAIRLKESEAFKHNGNEVFGMDSQHVVMEHIA